LLGDLPDVGKGNVDMPFPCSYTSAFPLGFVELRDAADFKFPPDSPGAHQSVRLLVSPEPNPFEVAVSLNVISDFH
jgi:hypothetical protein